MDDYALVFNAGSSSLKFSVFGRREAREERAGAGTWHLASRGQIDGIGRAPELSVADGTGASLAREQLGSGVGDGRAAIDALADWLRAHYGGSRVLGVGHRVVHGGPDHVGPCIVTPPILAGLRKLIPLAPLHQPYNLAAIDAVTERMPGVPQVACFDTSFHRGHAPVAELVALPARVRDAGVQRYGFHGLSFEYIASVLPQVAPKIADGRVIVAHLGNGASLCAMRDRRSIDSTLGFTALGGLCMGTRPGTIDPGVILHLFQTLGMTAAEVEHMLYRESGLLGISGLSNDMRDLLASSAPGARLAVDYFVYQACKQIGALAAVLGGVDALVFTAGIGEHSPEIRRRIAEGSAWLGLAIDARANEANAVTISSAASAIAVHVVPTNEELMIALHMQALLGIGGGPDAGSASMS